LVPHLTRLAALPCEEARQRALYVKNLCAWRQRVGAAGGAQSILE